MPIPKKDCVHCGHAVGAGGDRHALKNCPPKYRPGDNRGARRQRNAARKRAASIASAVNVKRGAPVKGTGRPRGE